MLSATICRAENLQCMDRNGPFRPLAKAWVDKNNKYPTGIDENGDTNPVWDTTLHIPLDRPIDDTTLKIVIFDARKDGNEKRIGSAKLNLQEVKNDAEGRERTLTLKRRSFRSRGQVVVKVLIEKQPQKGKKKKGRSVELANTLITGATTVMGLVGLAETSEGLWADGGEDGGEDGQADGEEDGGEDGEEDGGEDGEADGEEKDAEKDGKDR